MHHFTHRVFKWILAAILPLTPCSADLSLKVNDYLSFSKTSATIEHLDHDNYRGTAESSAWVQEKEFISYILEPELIWVGDIKKTKAKYYILGAGLYGWLIDGKRVSYPLGWSVEGNQWGVILETGYIMNVSDRFRFIPYIGFEYNRYFTKIKHQHLLEKNPESFVSQNGTKSHVSQYYPYIGVEVDFKTKICKKDLQCLASYQFGFGAGHGTNKVHDTIITDDPNTSRYGTETKFRNMVTHEFEVATFYSVNKHWQVGLELDYFITYNTSKLPYKLDHNKEIVKAGQYLRSQFHRVSDFTSQTFNIIFSVIYNFSGEPSVVVK